MSRIDFWNFGKTQHLKKIPMKISSVVVMCQFLCILFHCRLNFYASLFLRLSCQGYITFRQQKLHLLTLDFLQCYQKFWFAFLLVSVSVGEVEAEDEERRPPAAAWPGLLAAGRDDCQHSVRRPDNHQHHNHHHQKALPPTTTRPPNNQH